MDKKEICTLLTDNIKLQTNGSILSDEETKAIEDTLHRCKEAILENNPDARMINGLFCGPLVVKDYPIHIRHYYNNVKKKEK